MSELLSQICCVCLQDNFDLNCVENNLIDKINSCSLNEILFDTTLAKYICSECENTLNIAFDFKQKLINNSKRLSEYLKHLNNLQTIDFLVTNERIISYEKSEENDFHFEEIQIKTEPIYEDENESVCSEEKFEFKCEDCGKNFDKKASFNRHMIQHKLPKIHPCHSCGEKFSSKMFLYEHVQQFHSKVKKHICPICSKAFQTKKNLTMHNLVHFPKYDFKCDICEKAFKFKSALTRHKKIHSDIRDFHCTICPKRFKSTSELRKHQISQHLELISGDVSENDETKQIKKEVPETITNDLNDSSKSSEPTETNAMLDIKIEPLDYVETATNEQQTEINTEYEIKSENSDSSEEEQTETKKILWTATSRRKNLFCKECNKKFPNRMAYRRHFVYHSLPKIYPCKDCNERFPTKRFLTEHSRIHYTNTPVWCEICNKSYPNLTLLKYHNQNIHPNSNGMKFKCTICDKIFNKNMSLQNHMFVHIKEKPFPCNQCDKKFKHFSSLNGHQMIEHPTIIIDQKLLQMQNTPEKTLHCVECNKTFAKHFNYTQHMNVHNKPKLFPCDMCDMKFSTALWLTDHKKTHKEVTLYPCEKCDKTFLRKETLRLHNCTM